MQPFARRIIVALALIALVVLLWYTAYVLLLAFAGILGAIVLDAITEWVRGRMRLSRDRAYLIVLAGVTSLIGVAIWQLAPRLIVQVSQLVQVVPRAIENLHYFLNQHGWGQRDRSTTCGACWYCSRRRAGGGCRRY
jgi:predicted PurR-regulated permease PerM